MFTGIIESTGLLQSIEPSGTNLRFRISSPISPGLRPDQSVAHDGVCLTVEEVDGDTHVVSAVRETLEKTCLSEWTIGRRINLERAMVLGDRLDGHLVQGHVDARGVCEGVSPESGSWLYRFGFPEPFAHLVIEKGSVCVNGISLTAFGVTRNGFSVAVIPYTYEHTNLGDLRSGDGVNLEFDMLGKYLARFRELGK
jgi:riboflavin synthase